MAVLRSAAGIPYLAPELQLLYKSKGLRPKDDVDAAEVILSMLDSVACCPGCWTPTTRGAGDSPEHRPGGSGHGSANGVDPSALEPFLDGWSPYGPDRFAGGYRGR